MFSFTYTSLSDFLTVQIEVRLSQDGAFIRFQVGTSEIQQTPVGTCLIHLTASTILLMPLMITFETGPTWLKSDPRVGP